MLSGKEKISIRQAVLLFLTVISSPAIRIVPVFAAQAAEEAAWLAPIVAAFVLFLIVLVWNRIYIKYKNDSLMHIYSDIAGKFTGKFLSIIYLLWVTLLVSMYVRYFAVRLVGSIYPDTNQSIFIISILLLVAYVMRYGLVTLARLNEVVLPMFVLTFFIIFIILTPYLQVKFLIPVTYKSILPVINAGMGIAGILSYYTFLFVIGDAINNKESIKRIGTQATIFIMVNQILLIVVTVGSFSYFVIKRSQSPLLIAVKQISLFNTLEKIESVVVAIWVFSDFILICFFSILALKIIKSVFGLSDERPLISIYMISIYFLALYIANAVFELERLSSYIIIPGDFILGFIIPVIMLAIGKIRKKI
ncbi:MAG: endospore germination permease [Clostridium sp.]|jgi:spore germination protein (amino acid permease)|nr:endospore germination permease [Clostridium sp.]